MATVSRRGLLRLGAAAGAGLALGACDVGGKSSGTQGSGSGTITALFMQQAGYSEPDIRGMTADFTAAHPTIKVEPTFVAYEALHDKIIAAAPAGTYDVVLIDVIWPAEFGSKRIVTDVTGKFPDSWKTQMLGGALTTAEYQDHFYGVPWILDTKYLYANTDLLSKAGVDPASLTTWDATLAAATAVKNKAGVKHPLIWSWKQAEALVCDYTQLLGAFSEGSAALALNWTYMYAAANDPSQSKVTGKVAIGPTPAGPGGSGPGVNGSMALCVGSGSKNQDAAWQYITYLTSQTVQNKYAKSSLPCWASSYADSQVVATSPQVVPAAKKELANLISRPEVPRYNEISQVLQTELQNALLGKKTPAKALADAKDQVTPLLS